MESSHQHRRALGGPRPRSVLAVPAAVDDKSRWRRLIALPKPGWKRHTITATRQVATLMLAGFTLDRALSSAARVDGAGVGQAFRDVQDGVRGGSPLAAALNRHPGHFGEFYRGMIAAGERSGTLAETFGRLADYLEHAAALRSRVMGALLYPAIMVVAGSLAVLLLLLFVIPRFAAILGDVGGQLPWSARTLVTLSEWVGSGWWVLVLVALATVLIISLHRRTETGRLAQDLWLLRIPGVGPLRARLATERVTRPLAGALGGGIPVLEALDIAGDAAADAAFRRELSRAGETVRRGEPLAVSLRRGGLFPNLAVEMIAAGEESGRLVEMLEHVAETYRGETDRQLRTLVSLVEPAVILLFGALVAFIALALLQTIYGVGIAP